MLQFPSRTYWLALVLIWLAVLIWSSVHPHDRLTWWLEAAPGLIGGLLVFLIYSRWPMSDFSLFLVVLHSCVLFVGAKYTYAEVPLFDWLSQVFDLGRNNYDKVGHFMQGFAPALFAREVMLRCNGTRSRNWASFFSLTFAMALSSLYEIIEWFAAVMLGQDADAFLGTQGYVWDTQSDMLWCMIGALIAMTFFTHWQDRSMRRFTSFNYS